MSRYIKIIFVTSIVMMFFNSFAQTNLTEAVDFTATDTEGNTVTLFDILDEGKYVVIDFFFTT